MSLDDRSRGGPALARGSALVVLVFAVTRCASGTPPPSATVAAVDTAPVPPPASEPAKVAPPASTTPDSPKPTAGAPTAAASSAPKAADAPDSCHVSEQLALAYETVKPEGRKAQWLAEARVKLLLQEDAQRAFTGIAQEIVSALAHKSYSKLAAFAPADGICLRAAKGAPCQNVSPSMLAACSASGKRTPWAVDDGHSDPPQYTCGEAFRKIFYPRDFLHSKAEFNCFPEPGRGSNASPIMLSGPRLGYVEFHTESDGGFRSLWLVFDGAPNAPELVEMISEYPKG
jgi:hypothetical protein